ncbi:MAG: PhnD/SsuA/transferrin family substrate-binding protein, partial [Anaerobacillus sp.]
MKKLTMIMMVLVLGLLAACSSNEQGNDSSDGSEKKDDEAFTIGVIPVQTEGEIEKAMNKLQAELSKKLDRDVEITTFPDYNGVVEAMNYNKIDMAYFGPLTYV